MRFEVPIDSPSLINYSAIRWGICCFWSLIEYALGKADQNKDYLVNTGLRIEVRKRMYR
jgi:hypothetical protein